MLTRGAHSSAFAEFVLCTAEGGGVGWRSPEIVDQLTGIAVNWINIGMAFEAVARMLSGVLGGVCYCRATLEPGEIANV